MPKNNALTILVTFILLASVAAWIRPDPAGAAIALKGEVKVEDVYNPNPAEGDLPLPMPCDLFMVFKAVSLPVTGSVRDYESFFGLDTQTENAFLENRHQVHLGSDLSVANLPQGLAEIASRALSQASTDQIYLIGKYEVTKGQWDAVMGDGKCAMDSKSARPIAEISYFQAESFAERYMAWLIANRPEVLPRYQGRGDSVGLVRLPTEEEWEYAARGGHEVSTDKIATQDFFDVPRDVDHRQYGLFSAAGYNNETEPGNIGRWKPNPLGLYDTAGNVSEMIASPFKMIKHKRVHGSAGGFVSKGGSFDQSFEYVLPGRRLERPYYFASGPTVSKDLGFRLVVVAPEAVTSTVRQDGFREAFSGLDVVPVEEGRDGPGREKVEKEAKVVDETKLTGIENKGPLDKINVLLETAVDQDQVDVFESLRADIQNINFNEASDDEVTIRTNCRNLLFVVYSIYNTDKRRRDALSDAQLEKDQLAQLDAISAAEKKKYRKQIQELTATIQKNLDVAVKQAESLELALAKEFNSYLDLLSKHDGFDRFEVNNVMILIQQDIKGDDIYAQAMRRAHQQVNLDLGHWRMNNKGAIGLEAILNNAI